MTDESSKPIETTTEDAAALDSSQVAATNVAEATASQAPASEAETNEAGASGPLNLSRIRELRKSQQTAPTSGLKADAAVSPEPTEAAEQKKPFKSRPGRGGGKRGKKEEVGVIQTPPSTAPKVEVPSLRSKSSDLEDELDLVLGGSDLKSMLIGDELLQVGHELTEGQRMQGTVLKTQEESVFVSLGGPNEGMIPSTQFEETPEIGVVVDVVVRGYSVEEGLYEVTLPGNAVEVSDWDDINEGEVVEAVVTGSNAGGLELKVGNMRGFMPASQVAEYRVENLGEMVGEKVLCLVTEANERRGNLVLSRRAVLEREKQEKRAERLEALSIGDSVEGTVTKIMDFGAFVDIGGLDGLLHISQLSWDRVNHPSEVVEQGQKVNVRVEKIDEQSGKIGLSYRSIEDHPWKDIDAQFPVGSNVNGTVSRIAEFGAFVKVATGVEGLVHISELAHHRVSNVSSVIQEGQEVEVKVLSVDADGQRMSLSLKGAQAAPESSKESAEAVEETPPPKPVLPKHQGPLKGGTGKNSGGEQFGLKW
ncbi:MAG: 30S ribosomal protein S1 [Pirellulaceae bacterium]